MWALSRRSKQNDEQRNLFPLPLLGCLTRSPVARSYELSRAPSYIIDENKWKRTIWTVVYSRESSAICQWLLSKGNRWLADIKQWQSSEQFRPYIFCNVKANAILSIFTSTQLSHIQNDAIVLATSVAGHNEFIAIYWGIKVGLWVDISHTRRDDVNVYAGGSCATVHCPLKEGLHPRWEIVPTYLGMTEWPGTAVTLQTFILEVLGSDPGQHPNYWYCQLNEYLQLTTTSKKK
jgi:hypothetical protein